MNKIVKNMNYYNKFTYYYSVKLNNTSDFRDFEIYAQSYTGITLGSEIFIYSYTGSTGLSTQHDPSYFI